MINISESENVEFQQSFNYTNSDRSYDELSNNVINITESENVEFQQSSNCTNSDISGANDAIQQTNTSFDKNNNVSSEFDFKNEFIKIVLKYPGVPRGMVNDLLKLFRQSGIPDISGIRSYIRIKNSNKIIPKLLYLAFN